MPLGRPLPHPPFLLSAIEAVDRPYPCVRLTWTKPGEKAVSYTFFPYFPLVDQIAPVGRDPFYSLPGRRVK